MNRTEHLQKALVAFTKLHKSCNLKVTEEIGVSDLQIKQLNYVNIIGVKEGVTYGDLADTLGITKPSVTSIANKLIKLGIVDKHQCKEDGRVFYLKLTEKGDMIYRSYDLVAKKTATIIIDRLDEDEVDDFMRLLYKIIE